ncbi:enoyl-CoA hydratase/isomerase family protein [Pseudomonas chlororaphis]|uniref:enoyl-CoA hydratase/isomerase family protein n=1 Tax=Pseudomonas chlororaphis TaxID=587753 RepID=UPI001B300E3D|nr:enoyl-CoA hydratase/isomerase family protein [Pseudomonas chlororaphis]MBP5058834.1 enoyl-CoA hydratase/isomerase family protein [Pseudomonas chlororaphis]MBP5142952.1 enoyl-CoA hydratase/isomerase family protein [Pseudomonas chlororaphis]QTT98284.1 enoyl-CoA hydratase/isomerase family protein [Pseudomonas chlororaphis]
MEGLLLGREGRVATIRIARPPHNFFDLDLLQGIADAIAEADADDSVVVTLLSAEGRSFCAGADFTRNQGDASNASVLYRQAARIFDRRKLLIAAVGGPAVGGGLGLALAADFRVASPDARFHANFAALGLHPGFALTATLPALVGEQRARDLLMTARRVRGEEALTIGLVDRLAAPQSLDLEAMMFAQEIAANAPLALAAIRAALPRIDVEAAYRAMTCELAEQVRLFVTHDFREGVAASAARRAPVFLGN